ncbi:hypothetical protein VTN02DRAFT_3621 [Thermoascus thermophilus]
MYDGVDSHGLPGRLLLLDLSSILSIGVATVLLYRYQAAPCISCPPSYCSEDAPASSGRGSPPAQAAVCQPSQTETPARSGASISAPTSSSSRGWRTANGSMPWAAEMPAATNTGASGTACRGWDRTLPIRCSRSIGRAGSRRRISARWSSMG